MRSAAPVLLCAMLAAWHCRADEVAYDACESLEASEKSGVRFRGVSECAGSRGGGYHMDSNDRLLYPLSPRRGCRPYGEREWRGWSPVRGAAAFTYRPDRGFFTAPKSVLACIGQGERADAESSVIGLFADREDRDLVLRAAIIDPDGRVLYGGETVVDWRPREPGMHRLVLAWDVERRYVAFTVDGRGPERAAPTGYSTARPGDIAVLGPDLSIGGMYGGRVAPGVYDEIKLYDAPVAVSGADGGGPAPGGLHAGRLLNDAVEDRNWSGYQSGAAAGEYSRGVMGSCIGIGDGGGLLYGVLVPRDGSRGQYQKILFSAGEIGFFMRPGTCRGTVASIPNMSIGFTDEGRLQVETGTGRYTGPPVKAGEWVHTSMGYDRTRNTVTLKLNGRAVNLERTGEAKAADVTDPYIRFGCTSNDPVPGRRNAAFDLDEVYVYDSPRGTCPEAYRVTFYSSFDRPGLFADYARGSIEALGRPRAAPGYRGMGFLSGKDAFIRYPYHAFYRVGQKATTTVNVSLEAGTLNMMVRPEDDDPARQVLAYIRAAGWGGPTTVLYRENGRLIFHFGYCGTLTVEKPLPAGRWSMVGITWDCEAGKAAVYVDGEAAAEEYLGTTTRQPGELPYSSWWAVGSAENGEYRFNGAVDELTVFSYALGPGEMSLLQDFYAKPPGKYNYPWEALSGSSSGTAVR
ncbi:MAG: hypothetical protein JW909_08075 [Planctomycetes bacterium]|nr:hypothetical protein [Planctomycetota bacterium]